MNELNFKGKKIVLFIILLLAMPFAIILHLLNKGWAGKTRWERCKETLKFWQHIIPVVIIGLLVLPEVSLAATASTPYTAWTLSKGNMILSDRNIILP